MLEEKISTENHWEPLFLLGRWDEYSWCLFYKPTFVLKLGGLFFFFFGILHHKMFLFHYFILFHTHKKMILHEKCFYVIISSEIHNNWIEAVAFLKIQFYRWRNYAQWGRDLICSKSWTELSLLTCLWPLHLCVTVPLLGAGPYLGGLTLGYIVSLWSLPSKAASSFCFIMNS